MSGIHEGYVAEFYRGRSVLVTGATGFMGKVLVEKLLRSCPGVERIFLLIRPKKERDISNRLQQLLNVPVFDWLRVHHPERLKKIEAVGGDLCQPALGLTETDQQRLQTEVSIVFHSAATVKFDEPLKQSVGMNVNGTHSLTQLCLNMPKLEVLVHISTAYCNCHLSEIHEKVYPSPADPYMIIQCVESLDEDILDYARSRITKNYPNTYTFTKALAENVLLKQSAHLPIAIIRPSIVTAAWKEPLPGWVDNLNGPTGMIVGAGKGLLRSAIVQRKKVADLIPVDIPINLAITVAWHKATTKARELQVYNCTSGTANPIKWREIEELGKRLTVKQPFNDAIWYPGGSFKSNRILHYICVLLFQFLPAFLLDGISLLCGQKPVLLRVQKKILKALSALEFFTTNEWKFISDNMVHLRSKMHPADRDEFNFDISTLNWEEYFESYILGARQYILKEDLKTLSSAKKHMRRMFWIHNLTQILLVALAWWVLQTEKISTLGQSIFIYMSNFISSLL